MVEGAKRSMEKKRENGAVPCGVSGRQPYGETIVPKMRDGRKSGGKKNCRRGVCRASPGQARVVKTLSESRKGLKKTST